MRFSFYPYLLSRSLPLPGMAALVLLLEILDGEPGVVLEGVERLVAEQFLDACPA